MHQAGSEFCDLTRPGHKYRKFLDKSGEIVLLRSMRWEDLGGLLELANDLVAERDSNSDLGIILDKRQTKDSEAQFVSSMLLGMKNGSVINVLAEANGKVVANSEITRGKSSDEYHHGKLGIAIIRKYRDRGIGSEMLKTLIEESRRTGIKTLELEVFADNQKAAHLYKAAGFKRVGTIPKKIFRKGKFHDMIVMSMVL